MAPKSHAVTLPANPPGTKTPLTAPQLWAALQLKIRKPQLFVPAIASCTVSVDQPPRVERDVHFGSTSSPAVREVVTWDEGTLIEFLRTGDGSRVTNVLSYGEKGEVLLTFGFHLTEAKEGLEKMAEGAVRETIDVARDMVEKGEI